MGSQLPALEQLFDEWSKKHAEKLSTAAPYEMPEQEEPYGGFVRDGIVNLESWKKQKVRICFILNEAGGRFDMEHYPEGHDLAAEWNEKGSFSKFMFKLSVWTKAIQDAFGQPTTYKKADVVKIRDDLIRSIAIINIKKSDGNRRTDFALLQRFAWEDAEELRRELELVNPNIIICGENLKFLREPFVPKPPKKKEGEEGTDTAVATAESSDATVAPAEVEAKVEIAETESVIIPAETETETEDETASKKHKRNVDSTESALVAAFKPPILPPYKEDGRRNYVFLSSELKQISKFTYLWGNKLVFSMWTPANFTGTISSNTINYYAVREVIRAALKAFGEKQKRQKIQQMNEQKHQEKLQRKLEAQQKKAAQAQAQGETPAQPQPKAETPQATAPAETPAKVETAAEVKPQPKVETPAPAETPAEVKPKKATKTKTAATAETPAAETPAEAKPKKTTRTKTKAATAQDATAETPAPKTRTRKTAAKPKEE